MADELFTQADVNKDERLDLNEFRNLIAQNLRGGSADASGQIRSAGVFYESPSVNYLPKIQNAGVFYESPSVNLSGNVGATNENYGGVAALAGATLHAPGGASAEASYGSSDQSSYGGFATEAAGITSSSTFQTTSSQQQVQVDANNPQNLYQDPNPQIIRRPALGGQITYVQNIKIRFLQPPPIPPPGPLIIQEVRPPQPPAPPPLRIRQRAPPVPQPSPLILRERPPNPPAIVGAQTVIRNLPALPVPPRSIIIERLPALPAKPRDIIIERWIPYGAVAKRKTIVQRAENAKQYRKPRNIIIQYEPVQVSVVRQFQRLGITQENPQFYIQRYGVSLLDAQTLIQRARAAGVIEDISPPTNVAIAGVSSTSFNAEFNSASSGIETASGVNLTPGRIGLTAGSNVGVSASSFESAQGGSLGSGGTDGFSSSYESNSFTSQGGDVAFGRLQSGGATASKYESYGASSIGVHGSATDPVTAAAYAAFLAADLNKDGGLDPNEFRQFVSAHLRNQQ